MKEMKKILSCILVLALALTLFAGCSGAPADADGGNQTPVSGGEPEGGSSDEDAPDDSAADAGLLGDDNVFTVGFDQEFPPFGYVGEDGEFTGLDLEMAKELCARLGWEIKLQPIDWDAKDFELESGTIDCIWNGFTMNGREDDYTWSVPYYDNTQVFVVRSDSGISGFDDLAGKMVEVQKDSSALAALNDNEVLLESFGQLISVADYNSAFMDLEMGVCNAVAIDAGVAAFQISGREDEFSVLEEAISTEEYAIGFLKGNTELCDAVEAELLKMAEDGTMEQIVEMFPDVDKANISLLR